MSESVDFIKALYTSLWLSVMNVETFGEGDECEIVETESGD